MSRASILQRIPTLQPQNWEKADYTERRLALQKLENEMASEQGREPCTVVDSSAEANQLGKFERPSDGQPGVIKINERLVSSNDPRGSVETLGHEGRHAYQWDCVENPESHQEISDETRSEWADNFDDYKSPEEGKFAAYENQPVEVDARQNGESLADDLYGSKTESETADVEDTAKATGTEDDLGEGIASRNQAPEQTEAAVARETDTRENNPSANSMTVEQSEDDLGEGIADRNQPTDQTTVQNQSLEQQTTPQENTTQDDLGEGIADRHQAAQAPEATTAEDQTKSATEDQSSAQASQDNLGEGIANREPPPPPPPPPSAEETSSMSM